MADEKKKPNYMVLRGFFMGGERMMAGDVIEIRGDTIAREMLGTKHVIPTDAAPKRVSRDKKASSTRDAALPGT